MAFPYPYRVAIRGLKDSEVKSLRLHLDADGIAFSSALSDDEPYDPENYVEDRTIQGEKWTAGKIVHIYESPEPESLPCCGEGGHVVKQLVEFGLEHSSVLLSVAGAVGTKALDVLADRVKKWLAKRTPDRTVRIYGPDNEVVRIVKIDKEIRTSSKKRESRARSSRLSPSVRRRHMPLPE